MSDFFDLDLTELSGLEAVTEEASRQRGSNELKFYFLNPGVTQFILLPPYSKAGRVVRGVFSHYISGKVVCPKFTYQDKNWPCPVCVAMSTLNRQPAIANNQEAKKRLGKYGPSVTFYANVLLLSVPTTETLPERVPHILRMSYSVGQFVMEKLKVYGAAIFNNPAMAMGFEVMMKKTGDKKTDVEYTPSMMPGFASFVKEGTSPAEVEGALSDIKRGIFDLDVVFGKKWTKEAWVDSVGKANAVMAAFNFQKVEPGRYPQFPSDELQDDGKPHEVKQTSSPAPAPVAPVTPAPVTPAPVTPAPVTPAPVTPAPAPVTPSPAAVELSETAVPAPVSPTSVVTTPAAVELDLSVDGSDQVAPAEDYILDDDDEVAVVSPTVGGEEIEKDPSKIDPNTSYPYCFGTTNNDGPCISCPHLDPCLIATMEGAIS